MKQRATTNRNPNGFPPVNGQYWPLTDVLVVVRLKLFYRKKRRLDSFSNDNEAAAAQQTVVQKQAAFSHLGFTHTAVKVANNNIIIPFNAPKTMVERSN